MVEVRVFATLRVGRNKIEFFEGEKVRTGHDICKALNIEDEEIAIYLINGIHSHLGDAVADKDVVSLFPAVGGG